MHFFGRALKLGILAGLLALCGCASQHAPSPSSPATSKQQRHQLLQLSHWHAKGAFALHTETHHLSANLAWQQQGRNYDISFFGPMGMGVIQVQGNPERVRLQTGDGKVFYAKSPEELLRTQLGWNLPISHLYYWIRGLPVPGIPSKPTLDQDQRLVQLRQADWLVSFKQYSSYQGIVLPTNIILQNPQLNLRLVISQWVL